MTCSCPNCGYHADSGISVNLEENAVSTELGRVKLGPIESEITYVLAQSSPEFVSVEDLYKSVYGSVVAGPCRAALFVRIGKVREKIAAIGIKLQALHGGGYRVIMGQKKTPAAVEPRQG